MLKPNQSSKVPVRLRNIVEILDLRVFFRNPSIADLPNPMGWVRFTHFWHHYLFWF